MNPDPQAHPVFEIAGTTYELKLRAGDVIRLKKKHQVEINELNTFFSAEAVEKHLLILQAAVSHKVNLTMEFLEENVEWTRMAELNVVIQEVISKVSAQMIALQPRINVMLKQGAELKALNAKAQEVLPAPVVQ